MKRRAPLTRFLSQVGIHANLELCAYIQVQYNLTVLCPRNRPKANPQPIGANNTEHNSNDRQWHIKIKFTYQWMQIVT